MLSEKLKKIDIKVQKNLSSFLVWNYKTFFKWRWLEFIDFREYVAWDDTKNIDFIVSSREQKTVVRQYMEERELSIIFMLDLSPSMQFWVSDKNKIEMLEEIFFTLAYSANANNDKIWLILQDFNKISYFTPKKWKANMLSLASKIEEFSSKNIDFDINSNINFLNNLKSKNNLVFIISDKLDINDKILKIASIKNEIVFVSVFDDFENTLNWLDWLMSFSDESWNTIEINLNDEKKKIKYLNYRQEKLDNFRKKLAKLNIKYLSIDNKKNIFGELLLMFKK